MILPILLSLTISSSSIQAHYDFLRQARNPFESIHQQTDAKEVLQPTPTPEILKQPDTLSPEQIAKLNQLKAVVLKPDQTALLFFGNDITQVKDEVFGFPIQTLRLDRIVLQNQQYRIQKIIGKPVEIIPLNTQSTIDMDDSIREK